MNHEQARPPGTTTAGTTAAVAVAIAAAAVVTGALLALAPMRAAATPALPPGALRVQQVEIVDARGFERPMRAATMLVPAGWQAQGEVLWATSVGCGNPYQARLLAQAPDGRAAITLAPGEAWGASNLGQPVAQGCPQAGVASAQDYLKAWVQRHRPGAQWLDFRPRPDRSRAGQQQSLPGGGSIRSWIETGQALIAYPRDGQPQRETLAVTISFTHSEFPMVGRAPMQAIMGESYGVLAWRAPAGELDFRQFDALWHTLRADPAWKARVDEGMRQIAQDNAATQARISQIQAETSRETLAHIARRGEIRAQTQAEIAQIRNDTWQSTQASQDRMHRDKVRTLREVEHYRNPSGGMVELPNHYPHAWKLRDGSYVLTDSPAFDPGRDLGVAGEKLQLAPR